MLISAVFSKPSKNCRDILGKDYIRVRIWRRQNGGLKPGSEYDAEFFTTTQSFRKSMSEAECTDFLRTHAGTTFKAVTERTESEEISVQANRRGQIRTYTKPYAAAIEALPTQNNRQKNYLLKEGEPLPFFVKLGIMTREGQVVAKKYAKFRQINHFVSLIADIVDDITPKEDRPLRILDFGCGKSYLTFALYHYLNNMRNIKTQIEGLDLKESVIADCAKLAKDCGYEALSFSVGDIASYTNEKPAPDLIITLHACDTATDYALAYAVHRGVKAIMSVPCCQHEVNAQLDRSKEPFSKEFEPFLKYGIIKERFAALATDAIRAELLEQSGYSVQVLEFIDMDSTPKNLLIRAIKRKNQSLTKTAKAQSLTLMEALHIEPKLSELLQKPPLP